jgi:hypothetical protein
MLRLEALPPSCGPETPFKLENMEQESRFDRHVLIAAK